MEVWLRQELGNERLEDLMTFCHTVPCSRNPLNHSHAEPLNYSLAVLGPSVMKRSDSQESVWLTHTNTHTHKGLEDPQYSDPSRALAFIRGQMVALKQEVIDIMTWPSQQAVCDVFLRHTGRQISCTSTVCRPCLCHSV